MTNLDERSKGLSRELKDFQRLSKKLLVCEFSYEEEVAYGFLYAKLGLSKCEPCEGEGIISMPSMAGYGVDSGTCNKCQGSGIKQINGKELYGESWKLYSSSPDVS
jgi:DnaJ-class molecular chaperone